MAFNISSPGVIIFLLVSSVYSVTLSVPQHEGRVFIAKSWGVPVKLTCDDRSTRRIDISGISLFKFKHTFEADDYFPGIKAQSQRECQLSFHSANKTVPAECELRFQGKVLPFDVMVVAVYRCLAPALLPNETIHTGTSETGDVELGCGFGNIIDVLDVTINKSKLGEEDNEIAKQRCSMEMFQQQLPAQEERSNRKKPVVCTVLREGRLGKLMVKYLCLPAPLTGSGQIVDDNTNVGSQQKNMNFHHSQHHYKNGLLRLSRSQT